MTEFGRPGVGPPPRPVRLPAEIVTGPVVGSGVPNGA